MNNQQNSKFETIKSITFAEDFYTQYRASIVVVEKEKTFIAIAKFFQNPKNQGRFLPTHKQVFLKPDAFKNLLEHGGALLEELGVFIFANN